MFGEVADMRPDVETLGLARPKIAGGQPIGISAPPSPELKAFIQECAERADRLGDVPPEEDNMLKIVNDANKAALDMRLINPDLPDDPNSKVNLCVAKIAQIYRDTTGVEIPGVPGKQNLAQIVFLDTSTPGPGFNIYDDLKAKLIAAGIPENEIAYIHDAETDAEKKMLFDRVNAGEVRVLIGSTWKIGTGANIQRRLVALHHLDAPWRPADVEQREGRILRQGNMNPEVQIYRYVTEGSFDVYRWQVLQSKARFIAQVTTGDLEGRSIEDVDAVTIGYAEMKALATGNPVIIERIRVDGELRKLENLRRAHINQQAQMQVLIEEAQRLIESAEIEYSQLLTARAKVAGRSKEFALTVDGQQYDKREEAGKALMALYDRYAGTYKREQIGEIHGCPIIVEGRGEHFPPTVLVQITPEVSIPVEPSVSAVGNTIKLDNALDSLETRIADNRTRAATARMRIQQYTAELGKPFEHEQKMADLADRLAQLDAEIAELAKGDPTMKQMTSIAEDTQEN